MGDITREKRANAATGVPMWSLCLRWVIAILALAAMLFGSAGSIHVPMFWAYLLVLWACSIIGGLLINARHPDLVQERLHPGKTTQENITLLKILGGFVWIGHLGLAGLDVGRFHWSDSIPLPAQVAGLIGLTGAITFSMWALVVNRFASSVVRLQGDRGQYVVTTGPYRYVRHPMYSAGICMGLLSPVALGSWLCLLPMVPGMAYLVVRTVREDQFLQRELQGYAEYAVKVRFRLIPGIW